MAGLDGRFQSLAKDFSGALLRPADAGYDEARKVHNGLIDKRPSLIARCRGAADVADALGFARDAGLEVSIRGGGHNVSGRAVTDGGVMIDLSLMKGIHVDPKATAQRAQGGVTWREFNREAALYGLATTGERSPPRVSLVSPSAVGWAGLWENTVWRQITCYPPS